MRTRPDIAGKIAPPAHGVEAGIGRPGIVALAALLLLAGLPDAMVVPVLRGLTVERYGMSDASAHLFISASLVGATLVAGVATRLRRRFGARRIVSPGRRSTRCC